MPTLIRAKGLGTYHNELGLPEGSLLTADNIVIDKNDVIQSRRGFDDYGCTPAPCCQNYDQIFTYKKRLLVHSVQPCCMSKLFFDSNCQDGDFKAFSGFYEPLEAGLRIQDVESNANLYFTTADGIKKIAGTLDACCRTNFVTCGSFQATASVDLNYVASACCVSTVTRPSGSWTTDGFIAGTPITITGADSCCNNVTFTPISVCCTSGVIVAPCMTFVNSCCDATSLFSQSRVFITCAGGPKALDVSGNLVYESGGFLGDLSRTAYRILWGTKDANKVLVFGAPSSRLVVTNTDSCSLIAANVCLTFTIPSDVDTTCFFYQVFRSRVVSTCAIGCLAGLEPGDEMNQVFEASVKIADLTAGTISVKDTLCDGLRESGVLLYTNGVSGEGILQSNEKPPVAKDLELFRETVFFSNTRTIQRKQFNILGICCFKKTVGPFDCGLCSGLCINSCTNVITRPCTCCCMGSFLTDGFAVGQQVTIALAEDCMNDGEKRVTAVDALTLTLCALCCMNTADTTMTISTLSRFVIGNCTGDREYTFVGEKEVSNITVIANCCGTASFLCEAITLSTDTIALPCHTFTTGDATKITACKGAVVCQFNCEDIFVAACIERIIGCGHDLTDGERGQFTICKGSAKTIAQGLFNSTCDIITAPSHGFTTGERGQFTTTCADFPMNIVACTDYFIIRLSSSTFQIADTRAKATVCCPPTVFNFTDMGTGCHTFTPNGTLPTGLCLTTDYFVTCQSRDATHTATNVACECLAFAATTITRQDPCGSWLTDNFIVGVPITITLADCTLCPCNNITFTATCISATVITAAACTFTVDAACIAAKVDQPGSFQVAASRADALAGTEITLCVLNSPASMTFTPNGAVPTGVTATNVVYVRTLSCAACNTFAACPNDVEFDAVDVCNCCLSAAIRTTGSWICDGFVAGVPITITCACVCANNITFTPTAVTALVITAPINTFTDDASCAAAKFCQPKTIGLYTTKSDADCNCCRINMTVLNSPAGMKLDSDILNEKYFLINSAANEKKYFFWFESVSGTSTPGTPCVTDVCGRLAVKVSICIGDSAACIAAKLQTSINSKVDFSAVTKIGVGSGTCGIIPCGVAFVTACMTIVRADPCGSWLTDNFISCSRLIITCSCASANDGNFCITAVTATTITVACALTCDACDAVARFNSPSIVITYDKNGNAVVDPCDPCCSIDGLVDGACCSTGFNFCVVTQGDGACSCCNHVLLSSQLFACLSIDETARSLVNIINRDCCGIVNAFYLSGEDDLPGIILLESRNLSDEEFYLGVCNCMLIARFNPGMPCAKYITGTAACGSKTKVTTLTCHCFLVNDCVFIYNVCCANLACKFSVVAKTDTTFTVAATFGSCTTGRVFKADEASDNCVKPNRLFFSKTGIPEAVPLVNFLDVGRQDSAIRRILALRDNLFVMKDDGVFILTGDCGCFTVRLLGSSTNIVAPDSAAVLNNQIFMLSTQGVVSVSDTGIGVVSRPVEDKILDVTGVGFCASTIAFGVNYESDRSYLLWLPSTCADTAGTQVYRYNTFNKSWVRWTVEGRAGVVNPVDDKLYISSGCNSFIKQERKTNDRTDFADRQFSLTIPFQCIPTGDTLVISSVGCLVEGDVLVQTQQITLAKFNRLLKQLDTDPLLTCTDYLSTISICTGECLAAALILLELKVCADDPCGCYCGAPTAAPSTFTCIRLDFNTLTSNLNCSSGTTFNNYDTIGACCTTDYEVIITGVCSEINSTCLGFSMPIIAGPIIAYKGINTVVEWAPQHFGDPSVVKQIPESTLVFDGNNFFKSKIGFSTDISKCFSCFEFSGRGPGFWGGFVWNCSSWGGCGTDVPYRTIVPRQKQRCRYITAKFKHGIAREDFNILGISFEVRPLSTRGYRTI